MPDNNEKSAGKSNRHKLPDGRVAPGRGPAKGAPNAGRPRNEFREMMREITDRGAQAILAHQIAENPNHPYFMHAIKWAASYAEGMPVQRVETRDMGIERPRVVLPPIAEPGAWPPEGGE